MELMSPDTAPDLVLERAPSRAQQPQDDGTKQSNPFAPGRTHFPLTIAQTPIVLDSLALPGSPVANTGDIAHIHGPVETKLFAAACRQVVAETAAIRVSLDYRHGALLQKFPELDDYALEHHDFSASDQ